MLGLVGRLAVLVPRPRVNLILYHGVPGARAAWRPEVVPHPASDQDPAAGDPADSAGLVAAPFSPNFGRPVAFVDPRRAMSGVRLNLGRP